MTQPHWGIKLWKAALALAIILGGGAVPCRAVKTAAVPTPSVSDTVAYRPDRLPSGEAGAPLVEVTLNGGMRATFLVDTGTSGCAVTDTMAAKLGLTPRSLALKASPLIMSGETAQSVPLTIQLGRFRFSEFPTLVIKESRFQDVLGHPLDGILGINLLRHFAVILEPNTHVMILQTPGKLSAEEVRRWGFRQAAALTLSQAHDGTYWAPVGLANGTRTAQENLMIDTGAVNSILAGPVAQSLGLNALRKGITMPFGNGVFVGDYAKVPAVTLGTVADTAASTLTFRNGGFLYAVGPEQFGMSPHVLGMNILSGCSVLLDFPGTTLYLQPTHLDK